MGSGNFIPNYTDANVAAVDAAYAADLVPGWIGPWMATTHFVVDTSRNGRGALDPSSYASAPYNQSASVIQTLKDGNWWMVDPAAGLWFPQTALQLAQNATPPLL